MAEMSSASINNLPDSAFAYIESGGSKDSEGKTVPRSLRHFPIHDAAHVRNALARLSQSPFGAKAKAKVMAAARKYNVELFDGLPHLLLSGLRRKVYGSSFRFRVVRDHLEQWPERSGTNPDGWPERTIQEVEVFEFGPVVNPAYAGATAGIRSTTDWFMARQLAEDPRFRDIF